MAQYDRIDREKASKSWGTVEKRADGHPACRQCGAACTGRRRSFCCQACVDTWCFSTNPGHVRRAVEQRDHGVCRSCGVDTVAFRARLKRLNRLVKSKTTLSIGRARRVNRILARHGWIAKRDADCWSLCGLTGALWQADHIVAVKLGGGLVGIDGYQTLCTPCHKRKTREDRAAMRAAKGT